MITRKLVLTLLALLTAATITALTPPAKAVDDGATLQNEKHLRNIRQLTFGGENAEAYFSSDGKQLIYQYRETFDTCDQIYIMNIDGSSKHRVSTGKGRTTCSYFYPNGKWILYSSTHHRDPRCPPKPDYTQGYVWSLDPNYDIFIARPDGSHLRQLTHTPGYDAESVISQNGESIVFTSTRNGDIDIYTMDAYGGNVRQLTQELGYDGGPWFSFDGRKIVYRAYYPKTAQEIEDYKALLEKGLIRPTRLDIFVMDSDGGNKRQLTNNGAANFAPSFAPDGRRIIFVSNLADPRGRNFDLYLLGIDGRGLERVTYDKSFDGFPMFSPDGKKLVFASNRNDLHPGETNIFMADWVD